MKATTIALVLSFLVLPSEAFLLFRKCIHAGDTKYCECVAPDILDEILRDYDSHRSILTKLSDDVKRLHGENVALKRTIYTFGMVAVICIIASATIARLRLYYFKMMTVCDGSEVSEVSDDNDTWLITIAPGVTVPNYVGRVIDVAMKHAPGPIRRWQLSTYLREEYQLDPCIIDIVCDALVTADDMRATRMDPSHLTKVLGL